jgi:hypothetical protein
MPGFKEVEKTDHRSSLLGSFYYQLFQIHQAQTTYSSLALRSCLTKLIFPPQSCSIGGAGVGDPDPDG